VLLLSSTSSTPATTTHWSNNEAQKAHKLGKHAKSTSTKAKK